MPPAKRPHREPTDDWQQLRLYVVTPEQEAYELLRPIVLFGQTSAARARETGVAERALRRKADRFDTTGWPACSSSGGNNGRCGSQRATVSQFASASRRSL